MFAKLKKKIEEEVGDLGQLTSPLANPFGSGDRRVGGSTQGTNTPNNLGSRQSSLASLVDIHPQDEPTSPGALTNISLAVPLTPTPVVSPRSANSNSDRQKSHEAAEAELKRNNAEWLRKYESMKKSFEERLQNQEADFAWKYGSKEEELEKLRAEKRKAEDLVKTMEGSYQNKMTRVQDDMDQLEGFTKQEMAKVKHLLLNTQADLQKAQSDVMEQANLVKELGEENKQLKAENETIIRNLDRDKLNRVKFESEHGDTLAKINQLQVELQKRDEALRELRLSLEHSTTLTKELTEENTKLKTESDNKLKDKDTENKSLDERRDAERADMLLQVNTLQSQIHTRDATISELRLSLQNSIDSTNSMKEDNKNLNQEKQDIVASFERQKQEAEEFKIENANTGLRIKNLELEIQQRDTLLMELRSSLEELLNSANMLKEENKVFKADYAELLQNLDNEKQERQHSETEYIDRISVIELELKEKDNSLLEIRNSQEETLKQLLSTQAELKKAQSDVLEQSNLVTEFGDKNRQLKAENENILKNVDRESEHGETIIQINQLQSEIQQRDSTITELRSSLDHSDTLVKELTRENNKLKESSDNLLKELDIQKSLLEAREAELSHQVSSLQNAILFRELALSELQSSFQDSKDSVNLLEQANSNLKAEKQILEENLLQAILQCEKLKTENADTALRISNLELDIQQRDTSLIELRSSLDELQSLTDLLNLDNSNLKMENGNLLANVEQAGQGAEKLKIENADTALRITNFEAEIQHRDSSIVELHSSLEKLINSTNLLKDENEKVKADYAEVLQNLDQEKLKNQASETERIAQLRAIEADVKEKNSSLMEFRASEEETLKQLHQARDELRQSSTELTSCRQQCKQVETQHQEAITRINELEAELLKRGNDTVNSKVNGTATEAEEDVETYKEKIRELEAKLTDKNKALKLRQQQLQDLRKTLAKEMKGNSSAQLQPTEPELEYFHKSPSQISLASSANDVRIEEISQTDTEPAVIPSSNSNVDASYSYANDVNFQYMKTVIFKFVTSPDPQVTQHLTKIVSTLLHLSDEEARILEKHTDKRILSWLGSREHQGF